MAYTTDLGNTFDHIFEVPSDYDMIKVLEHVLKLEIKGAAEHGYDNSFNKALQTYCVFWAESNGYKKPDDIELTPDMFGKDDDDDDVPEGWSEVSNEAQTDPEISALRRDLNFVAKHLCVTLPSTKDEEEDEGFRW